MVRFPEDVALTRDALALLGHIASLEASGRTFLTLDHLCLDVVEALQRHVTDLGVAVSSCAVNGMPEVSYGSPSPWVAKEIIS